MTERVVFHVDLDAFFVAVERVLDPSLIGKPVIVGGLGPRGVVSTASYEARKFGVNSAMPMAIARRRCPQAVFLPGNHGMYRDYSRRFFAILNEFSPTVQGMSVDEAYVDMTGTERLLGPPVEVAERIRSRIKSDLGITASIGIGPNRLVAKVASGKAKPDGVRLVPPDKAESFFAPLPVTELPGIGPRASEALHALGVRTLGELAGFPDGPLRRALGPNHAVSLKRRARGQDDSPVSPHDEAKSISAETTFSADVGDLERLREVISDLSNRVGMRLRRSQKLARTVTIKVRYPDFSTITRQLTLASGVDTDGAIFESAFALFAQARSERPGPFRLIGVGVGGLSEHAGQLSLLDADRRDDSALDTALDAIREKFGPAAIRRGARGRLDG